MQSFKLFLEGTGKSIHYFDIDDTLMHTSKAPIKVHVRDENGNHVGSLDSAQYNHHKLQPGHSYDFSEFRSSEKFAQHAKPVRKLLAKMKAIHKNGGKTEMLTARSDFDDKEKFAAKWKAHGVDISPGSIHVRRAGNLTGVQTHEAKAKIISDAINKQGHKEVHLYDDHKKNIDAFMALKEKHPDVTFHGHHVEHNSDGTVKLTHYKA